MVGRVCGVWPRCQSRNLKHFSTRDVEKSYRRLNECSAGIDGLTKMRAKPAATLLLHEIAALFSYIYAFGTPITDWNMSIVTSIRKKCLDLWNMDSYCAIDCLSLVRQWFALTLLPEIEELCARIIPENQQGFVSGGRCYAAILALSAIFECYRLRNERIWVVFVDVRKAFPSANRDVLLRKLSAFGASDSLVRAVWALYHDAQGTVRGASGYGRPFPLVVGTREGGVESPLLYTVFVCDIISRLDRVDIGEDRV